jgi:ribosomal protein L22
MIQTRAYLKSIRLSPIKAGLVADAVRGKHVQEALDFLTFSKKMPLPLLRSSLSQPLLMQSIMTKLI